MKTVHIIGPGVVGKATGSLFKRFGNQVIYTDTGDLHRDVRADAHFICVPEAAVPAVADELLVRQVYGKDGNGGQVWIPGLPDEEAVVIRSSVKPGITRMISNRHDRGIFHNPEFLRASTAETDLVEARHVVLGVVKNMRYTAAHIDAVQTLYASCGKEMLWTDAEMTELWKLASNAYLATLVSFWNQVQLIAEKYSIPSHAMTHLMVRNDPRISPYGALRHGEAYGGACLPKDLDQLIDVAVANNLPFPLLAAVKEINDLVHKENA